MANIDLTNFYRRRTDKVSSIDSEIILNKGETDNILYSDLELDLKFSNILEKQLNASENNKDLTKITNEQSVINSLKNILNTTRNTRILNPDMEFDLRSYLFEGLNATTAWFIGYDICTRINKYEPRITIKNINISIDWQNDSYWIDLEINIPTLNKSIKISSILDKDGFVYR